MVKKAEPRRTRESTTKAPGAKASGAGKGAKPRARTADQRTAAARDAAAPEVADRVIDAALALAAERGWRDLAVADIAEAAGVSLTDFYANFRSKEAILTAFSRRIDAQVLAGDDPDLAAQPVRDRLFDVLMRRFDALAPHRGALRAILRDSRADPLAAVCGALALRRSMACMLEAARLGASGLRGLARVKGLTAIYIVTLRGWLDDDSADQARTMAALDRRLAQAERLIRLCRAIPRPRRRARDSNPGGEPDLDSETGAA